MTEISHMLNRRRAIQALTGVAACYFVPAWNETVEAAETITCVAATPTVTEGPYWVDEKLFRSDIRTDPTTGTARAGIPLALTINVENLSSSACSYVSGAYVDIWHCDARGIYSDESSYNPGGGTGNVTTKGQQFLRGYQITDSNGAVKFTTIYPGWYSGRTIHIHVRVRTYSGNTVLSNFVTQIFFDETVNNAVLSQSAYSRTSNRDTSNSNDMVYNTANRERMLGATTGDVTAGFASTITIGAAFQTPAAAAPAVAAGGVANASSGIAGVAPNTWVSIYGTNLSTSARSVASTDLVNNVLPTSLGGVSVQVNGKAAFLQYVSASQVNVLTPDDSSTGAVAITVTNSAGTSAAASTTMQSALPGLSTLSGYVRAIRYPDGAIVNGTGLSEAGYTTAAAVGQGDVLALYGTGFGAVVSPPATGLVFAGAYQSARNISVTLGGISADVLWAGLVGPGLFQINIRVPASVGDGDQAIVASVDGVSSQSGAKLKVAASAKLASAGMTRRIFGGQGRYAHAAFHVDRGLIEQITQVANLSVA